MKQPIEPFLNFIQDDAWSQAQSEALIDLMIWTMYIDRSIRVEENDELDAKTISMNNNPSMPITQYLPKSIAKIRSVWTDQVESEVLLQEISMYLDSPEIRNHALELCKAIAEADGDLAVAEQAFLDKLATHFAS